MVCGTCWPTVSGGIPDGSPAFPHYRYGGLWKNRNANLKKRVGSGRTAKNDHKAGSTSNNAAAELSFLLEQEDTDRSENELQIE
ncbi:Uncharacterized protein conserved in bacteria (DUF2256) [Seminavis robusta]|uniref:Uncharacterized protein conserved in bacteria (DUF2256) n=1 Tax=Seminavis robusta TaxID=568900 RepID=A0A9N8EFU9_9STRA|nr:Uncharacterized protein conserved in bacteria (DUF2256) [Seminavis robusta]|eukprot:Sro938_g222280.1 Uncharacterized protein conserved in bacteria (DUF2256) (84) ;mRNA; r:12886-13137